MKNITKKQAITLVVLIIVLILVIAVQYFYRPVLEEKSELSDKIDKMSVIYDDMKMTASFYNIDVITYEDEKKLLDEKRAEFLPYMTSSEQDNMLTKMLEASGFVIESSVPYEENAGTVLLNCSLLTESKEIKDSNDTKSSSSKNSKDKNKKVLLDPETALAMCPSGGEMVSVEGDIMVLRYKTGEVSREISYKVKGTYNSIIDLVQKICAEKSIAISSLNFSSGDISDKQSEVADDSAVSATEQSEQSEQSEPDELINDLEEMISENTDETAVTEENGSKIVENGIYDVSISIKVYMYDRDFDWGTDDSEDEEFSDETFYEETEYAE